VTVGPDSWLIERVTLPAHAAKRQPGQMSSHRFQQWLGEKRAREVRGWDLVVLLTHDRRQAIACGCISGPEKIPVGQISLFDLGTAADICEDVA
jgi:hypothetical protein